MNKSNQEQVTRERDDKGTVRYFLNGKLHREDGPAIEYADGDKYWYINGELRRQCYHNGTVRYFENGQFHREDGPAVEFADGTKFWYIEGVSYNKNGPSSIWADGLVTYTNKQGYLHRMGGPAVIMPDGTKEWWINSKHLYSILPDGTIQWKIKMNYEYLYRNRPDGPDAYGWRWNSWEEILKYAD
jgi:hypothetical protein